MPRLGVVDCNMKKSYCSDGYVHLNMKGYKVWVNTVVDYVKKQYLNNATAEAKAAADVVTKDDASHDALKPLFDSI